MSNDALISSLVDFFVDSVFSSDRLGVINKVVMTIIMNKKMFNGSAMNRNELSRCIRVKTCLPNIPYCVKRSLSMYWIEGSHQVMQKRIINAVSIRLFLPYSLSAMSIFKRKMIAIRIDNIFFTKSNGPKKPIRSRNDSNKSNER
jgi:hypothetical protein